MRSQKGIKVYRQINIFVKVTQVSDVAHGNSGIVDVLSGALFIYVSANKLVKEFLEPGIFQGCFWVRLSDPFPMRNELYFPKI